MKSLGITKGVLIFKAYLSLSLLWTLQDFLYLCFDGLNRLCSKPIFNYLSFFQDERRRYGCNPELSTQIGVFVHIHPTHLQFGAIIFRDLIHDGTIHTTGSAPSRPEID